MKQLLPLLFIIPIISFSQCPDGSFTSQAEIDALAIDYPDCTVLNGSLIISGDDITDLSGLYQIVECRSLSISGNLVLQSTAGLNPNILLSYVEGQGNTFVINNNASLTEIVGLENLVNGSGFESDFYIENNPMLTSIAGVPNSFSALDFFYITNNDSLISLEGIENYNAGTIMSITDNDALVDLTGIGGGALNSAEIVIISNNDALQSLNGAEDLIAHDYLYIENNENLTDLSGPTYPVGYGDGLIIRNNPNLSVCNADFVCQYLYINGVEEQEWFPGIFENNAPGCNDNIVIEYGCELTSNDNCTSTDWPELYPPNFLLNLNETIIANNEFATTSTQIPSCNDVPNRKDVWFVFDAGDVSVVDISVQFGFNFQLWEGDCWSGELNHVSDACGTGTVTDIQVVQNGRYLIQVWDNNSGRMASSVPGWFNLTVQDASLSNEDFSLDNVNLFPNPITNELTIQADSSIDYINVYNVLGQQVYSLDPNINTTTIDTSTFNQGLYLVTITINGSESTYRIVKQ